MCYEFSLNPAQGNWMIFFVCLNLKDEKCQSVEFMKVKIDVAEARLAELRAEILAMTEEAQFGKVLTTAVSFQI